MLEEVELTSKQLIFCKEYIIDFNATRAAIEAGFSEKTAHSQGSRLLKNVKVKAYIDKSLNERADKLDITADKVLQEIASVAFFNFKDIYSNNTFKDLDQLEDRTAKAIGSVKVRRERQEDKTFDEVIEIKSNDKLRALDMLSKHIGLYEKDNEQNNKTIVIEAKEPDF